MKKIHKAYKCRIYPTHHQEVFLNKHFGCTRFVYNYFLNIYNKEYKNYEQDVENGIETKKPKVNYNNFSAELTLLKQKEEYDWLYEVYSQSLQFSLRNLDIAFTKFFNKKANYPKFKSKNKNNNSFTIPAGFKLKKENNKDKLFIPKLTSKNSKKPEGIEINIHRKIEGKMLFVTISKTPTNKYYASITYNGKTWWANPKHFKKIKIKKD